MTFEKLNNDYHIFGCFMTFEKLNNDYIINFNSLYLGLSKLSFVRVGYDYSMLYFYVLYLLIYNKKFKLLS